MALGVSRTYLGGLFSQGLVGHVASTSRVVTCSTYLHSGLAPVTRRNASTTAAQVKKAPVTAKSMGKAALANPPSPSRKAVAKPPRKKAASSEMETARRAAEKQAPITQQTAEDITSGGPKKYSELTEEDRLKELERMMTLSELMPTVDPWGQEVLDTLDVTIPYPVNFKSLKKETFQHAKKNFYNGAKNFTALSTMAKMNCIPGVLMGYRKGWMQQFFETFKVFRTQSIAPDALLAPFRQMALEAYEDMNIAIANRNERDIKKLSTWDYQADALELSKASIKRNPKGRLIWQLHRVVEPVKVLSLRVTDGYLAETQPRFGNRLMVHALVKFNTEQSLEMYSDRGVALHAPAPKADRIADSDKSLEKWRVPAEKRSVTEYLVLEKRMWVQGPWVFREQLYPSWSAKGAITSV